MILKAILYSSQFLLPRHRPLLALQEGLAAVRSASAMRKPILLLSALLASTGFLRGEVKTPENAPIEITSTGQTTYENGLATARDNVAIHVGDTDIFMPITRSTIRAHMRSN